MKAIAITIKPQHLCNILNGKKSIEVRKNKNLANAIKKLIEENGKARIVCICSKSNEFDLDNDDKEWFCWDKKSHHYPFKNLNVNYYNGKVVCEFECDKVEEIRCSWGSNFIDWSKYPSDERYDYYIGNEMDTCDICRVACLKMEELDNCLKGKNGYAIHISNLKIYERAKEIKKAPQNYCYVEVEE